MAVREIITIGHPTLARKASPIDTIDDEIVRLAADMVETLHRAPGIGLAAPQLDADKRLIVADLSVGEKKDDLIVLVNPEIVSREGEALLEEGCLSVPDIREKVARPFRVLVRGLDLNERAVEIEAEDLLARVLCHEVDHLDGILFVDRLSPLKRALIRKMLKKSRPAGAQA
ncbi:MAG: peptide deformylase [Candidatus Aminicenantes bacterium]